MILGILFSVNYQKLDNGELGENLKPQGVTSFIVAVIYSIYAGGCLFRYLYLKKKSSKREEILFSTE